MPNARVAVTDTRLPGVTISPSAALSIAQAIALRDGLNTIRDVIAGLTCQPRFQGRDAYSLNAPGRALEDLSEELGNEMARLVTVIRAGWPVNDLEAHERAAFLATYEIENDGCAADALIASFMSSRS